MPHTILFIAHHRHWKKKKHKLSASVALSKYVLKILTAVLGFNLVDC